MIYTLASIFTFSDEPAMETSWVKIQSIFNNAGMALTPLPHFSWHVAQLYDFSLLEPRLNSYVKTLEPFSLHIAGIGVFSGENPVIYLPVTKTPIVATIHNEISQWIRDFTSLPNPNYDPGFWIPHITLSDSEFNSDGVCQVISELAYIPLDVEIVIDHIAIIYRNENSSGVRKSFIFGAGIQ